MPTFLLLAHLGDGPCLSLHHRLSFLLSEQGVLSEVNIVSYLELMMNHISVLKNSSWRQESILKVPKVTLKN